LSKIGVIFNSLDYSWDVYRKAFRFL